MRIDCKICGRHLIINYSEESPSAGVRVREGGEPPFYFDYYFEDFQELHKLVFHILKMGTHEGFIHEKK